MMNKHSNANLKKKTEDTFCISCLKHTKKKHYILLISNVMTGIILSIPAGSHRSEFSRTFQSQSLQQPAQTAQLPGHMFPTRTQSRTRITSQIPVQYKRLYHRNQSDRSDGSGFIKLSFEHF